MKVFVPILALLGAANALPQYYIADTPEVQAAKNQFAQAYNLAASRAAAPSAVPVNVEDPSNYSPAAEPYIHEEIPAVPYVHIGGKNSAQAAPVQPAAPATFTGTCYNWRGEGVPCRKQF